MVLEPFSCMQTPRGASGRPGTPSQRAALIGIRYESCHCLCRRLMFPCACPALKPALRTFSMNLLILQSWRELSTLVEAHVPLDAKILQVPCQCTLIVDVTPAAPASSTTCLVPLPEYPALPGIGIQGSICYSSVAPHAVCVPSRFAWAAQSCPF